MRTDMLFPQYAVDADDSSKGFITINIRILMEENKLKYLFAMKNATYRLD